jgi:hypothetical protein
MQSKRSKLIGFKNSNAVSKTLTNSYNTNQEINHQGIIDYPGNAETTKLISLSFEFSIAELEETNLMMNPDGRLKPHQ